MKLGDFENRLQGMGRALTGAWIETILEHDFERIPVVAPLRGRGLKPPRSACSFCPYHVAPLRGRGLKLLFGLDLLNEALSLPYGGVD